MLAFIPTVQRSEVNLSFFLWHWAHDVRHFVLKELYIEVDLSQDRYIYLFMYMSNEF